MEKKWADFCISAVKYDAVRKQIDKVLVHVDDGDGIHEPCVCPRAEVLKAMGLLKSFVTIVEETNGGWRKDSAVKAIECGGRKFLRTDNASLEADSLGSLPEF